MYIGGVWRRQKRASQWLLRSRGSPVDAQNAVRASQAKAIPFVKGLKLRPKNQQYWCLSRQKRICILWINSQLQCAQCRQHKWYWRWGKSVGAWRVVSGARWTTSTGSWLNVITLIHSAVFISYYIITVIESKFWFIIQMIIIVLNIEVYS